MTKKERKEINKQHLDYEIRELMAFAFDILNQDGIDRVVAETARIAEAIKLKNIIPDWDFVMQD